MPTMVALPDVVAAQLAERAATLKLSVEDLAAKLISDALRYEPVPSTVKNGHHAARVVSEEDDDVFPTLEEVVAMIKATPPNPDMVQPPTKTVDEVLAELARETHDEPRLTAEEWEREWWPIRAEMQLRDQLDDSANTQP